MKCSPYHSESSVQDTRYTAMFTTGLLLTLLLLGIAGPACAEDSTADYVGSTSCRACHESFYQLWAPSHHGLAMQPYTREFARASLTDHPDVLEIGDFSYHADISGETGVIVETGADKETRYEIAHVLGGKNVFYFLTPYDRGRLQTLPLAYDVNKKHWFDTAASGVRHFPGTERDMAVHWTDPMYTFNTSCYSCHVSQLKSNYDLTTDTYNTQWAEPGINCETCHGPSEKHVTTYQKAKETGVKPAELGLISTHVFTPEQTNSMCNSCHAKMSPITVSFMAGENYFDHYDLVALENVDFYPDGRDLGENYTMTSWRMSPCVQKGEMDCMHCHTSSGRYRFKEPAVANDACLPCHQGKVANIEAHSHHKPGDEAPACIGCHMPMTQFAHMNRTDHSMRPPVPAATLKYKSNNACNFCHQDKDAAWAQTQVTEWGRVTRQAQYMKLAGYIDQARHQNWQQLDQILAYVRQPDRDEIFAGSLIRLVRASDSPKKWPVLIAALEKDPSPFVRAAAAEALDGYYTDDALKALLAATKDKYRLVRVRAGSSMASIPPGQLPATQQQDLDRAIAELIDGMTARSDNYGSYYNLGNVYMAQRKLDQAVTAFQTASKLRPDFVPPYVNAAFVYNAQGNNVKAEQSFRKALSLDPNNVITLTNLAMLLGEMGRTREMETTFRQVLSHDPNSATASYNLGVLLADSKPVESLAWCKRAYELRPDDPKYVYTYAFYLKEQGRVPQAIEVLQKVVGNQTASADAYMLLGSLLEGLGDLARARQVYGQGARNPSLPQQVRAYFQGQAQRLGG